MTTRTVSYRCAPLRLQAKRTTTTMRSTFLRARVLVEAARRLRRRGEKRTRRQNRTHSSATKASTHPDTIRRWRGVQPRQAKLPGRQHQFEKRWPRFCATTLKTPRRGCRAVTRGKLDGRLN